MPRKRTVREGHEGDNPPPRRSRHVPSRPGTIAWGRLFGRFTGGPAPNTTGRFSEFGHSNEHLLPLSGGLEQHTTSHGRSTSASGLLTRTSAMLQRGRQRLTRRRRNGRDALTDEQHPVAGPSNQQGRHDTSTAETGLMMSSLPPAYPTRAEHGQVATSAQAGEFQAFTPPSPLPPPPPPPALDISHVRSQAVTSSISMDPYFASPPTYPMYPGERNHHQPVQGQGGPSNVVASSRQPYVLPIAAAYQAPASSFATATEAAQFVDWRWRSSAPQPGLQHAAPPDSYHNIRPTDDGGVTGAELPTVPRWDQNLESHAISTSGSMSAMPQDMWWGEGNDGGFDLLNFPATPGTEEWSGPTLGDMVDEEHPVYVLPWSPIVYPLRPPDDDTHSMT